MRKITLPGAGQGCAGAIKCPPYEIPRYDARQRRCICAPNHSAEPGGGVNRLDPSFGPEPGVSTFARLGTALRDLPTMESFSTFMPQGTTVDTSGNVYNAAGQKVGTTIIAPPTPPAEASTGLKMSAGTIIGAGLGAYAGHKFGGIIGLALGTVAGYYVGDMVQAKTGEA